MNPVAFMWICFAIAAGIIVLIVVIDRRRRRMPRDAYDGRWGGHP